MYRFTAVLVLIVYCTVYSSRTPDERVRTLSSLFLCFSLCFRSFFGWASGFNGCLSNALLTAAVGLQMSGFEPSLPSCVLFFHFVFRCFVLDGWGGFINNCCCSYSYIFHSVPKNILVFGFPSHQRCGVPFFFTASLKPEISQKNPGYPRPTLSTLYQVTPRV